MAVFQLSHVKRIPQIAEGENEVTWKTFIGQLYRKGMTEETTKLVVSDGAQGLESALDYGPAVVNGQKLAVAITSLRPQRT